MGRNYRTMRKKQRVSNGGTKRFKQKNQKKKKELEDQQVRISQQVRIRLIEYYVSREKQRELSHKLAKEIEMVPLTKYDRLVSVFPNHHYLGENNFNLGLNEVVKRYPFVIYFYRFHRVRDVIEYPELFLDDNYCWMADVSIPKHAKVYPWADEFRTDKIYVHRIIPWNKSAYDMLRNTQISTIQKCSQKLSLFIDCFTSFAFLYVYFISGRFVSFYSVVIEPLLSFFQIFISLLVCFRDPRGNSKGILV